MSARCSVQEALGIDKHNSYALYLLYAFFETIYEQENDPQETINRFWKVCNKNLRKLENNLNYVLTANIYFMNRNNFQQNIHWINILKRVFGKNNLGRNGIYFLEQVLIYWETKNDDILLMVSEEEKELVNSRI